MSEKERQSEIKKEEPEEYIEPANKKIENDFSRKQESRMMNFFNQEFFERKIDFKPK